MVIETQNGHTHDLKQYLMREGHRFSFFQAVWLLEQIFPEAPSPGESPDFKDEPFRFRPTTSFGAQPNSVMQIREAPRVHRHPETDDGKVIEVLLSIMGLYGVESPLPQYLAEAIASEAPNSEALKDFLDIFNHRIYSLYYQAWKKYRHYLSFRPDGKDLITQTMLCLAGLGLPAQQKSMRLPPMRALAYAGLLGSRFHSADGLAAMISDYLDGVPVAVRELMPQWLPVPERVALGGRFQLGKNIVIGKKFLDLASKVRLVIGPTDHNTFYRLRPGTADTRALQELFLLYSRDGLVFDFEFILVSASIPSYKLGAPDFRLGWNIFLGKPKQQHVAVMTRPVSRNGGWNQTHSPVETKKDVRDKSVEKNKNVKPNGKPVAILRDSAIHETTIFEH
jgi:type VI secretion system protein ImpH